MNKQKNRWCKCGWGALGTQRKTIQPKHGRKKGIKWVPGRDDSWGQEGICQAKNKSWGTGGGKRGHKGNNIKKYNLVCNLVTQCS